MDDQKIIREYLAGDERAYGTLLKKYLKPVYNFLRQMVGDPAVLDDLTQDTFIKAWKNIRKFDQKRNFKTWLFTIAKNTAYDYFKKKKTIPFSAFFDEEGKNPLENMATDQILSDEILERKDFAQELEKILELIPRDYKIVLVLHYKEDFSLAEIAQILNEPYNTVKSRHSRALLAIRKVILSRTPKPRRL